MTVSGLVCDDKQGRHHCSHVVDDKFSLAGPRDSALLRLPRPWTRRVAPGVDSRLALIRACTIHPLLSALAEYLAVLKFPPATFYCPGNICGFGDRRTAGIVSALWCMTLSARLLETSYRLVLEDSAPIPDIAT